MVSVAANSVVGTVAGKGTVAVADIVTMAGGFVSAEVITIGVRTKAVSDDMDVDEDVQAATKTTTRMSTMI